MHSGKNRDWLYRIFEILPGGLTWATFIAAVVFSFTRPVAVAFFIILFDIYWLLKAFNIAAHLIYSHRKMRLHARYDWHARCEALSDIPALLTQYRREIENAGSGLARRDLQTEISRLEAIAERAVSVDYRKLWHLVIVPTYRENFEVLKASFSSYAASDYPKDRMIVVLACEERAGDHATSVAEQVKREFGSAFAGFFVTLHPDGVPGEARTKGANLTYAAARARDELARMNIDPAVTLVSAFDADTIVQPQYFSQLAYTFLTVPDPHRASYQPVPQYSNNIWDAPAVNRLVAINSSFWQMVESSRADRLITFSSHSMSFQTLIEVGYWPVDVISEDSEIFWRCLLYYHGAYRTEPLFTFVSLDAVVLETYTDSLIGQYKQNRRWAWGVEIFPYVMTGFIRDSLIPLWKRALYAFRLLEGHYFWATASPMIAVLGWLPLALGKEKFANQVLAANLPQITGNLMTISTTFLILFVVLYFMLLPRRPARHGRWRNAPMLLQWLLVPISSIFFGALPAIDAQTRLMLGKYMEFWVTPKIRKTESHNSLAGL